MAVSDVVTILLWPVYYFEFAKFVCKFVALAEVSIMVSSNTLTVLAVERYHAILKPFAKGLRLNNNYSPKWRWVVLARNDRAAAAVAFPCRQLKLLKAFV